MIPKRNLSRFERPFVEEDHHHILSILLLLLNLSDLRSFINKFESTKWKTKFGNLIISDLLSLIKTPQIPIW